MKRSKFTEEQIAFALKQAELGISVEEVCRKTGISEATFYVWRKKYGGVGPSELRRLRQLEDPDGHFKFPHLWPVKLPRAGRLNYGSTAALSAMREAASLRR